MIKLPRYDSTTVDAVVEPKIKGIDLMPLKSFFRIPSGCAFGSMLQQAGIYSIF